MQYFQKIMTIRHTLLFIMLTFSITIAAQNKEMEKFNIDSTLYVYYQRCKANIQLPVVLSMADTLFQMAGSEGDQRLQAVALSTKLDYYYFRGQEDSIIAWTEHVKDFAKATNQPKYYYFAWGKRLILFYIKSGKLNTALYEAQEMLEDAEKGGYKEGIAYCYDSMGDIYTTKRLNQQALDAKLKATEITETYNLDSYNLHSKHTTIAKIYYQLMQPENVLKALKKAEKYIYSNSQLLDQKLQYVNYFLSIKQIDNAEKVLKEAEELYKSDKTLVSKQKNLTVTQEGFYNATQQYQKALKMQDKQEEILEQLGESQLIRELKLRKGQTHYVMGQKALAADYLYEYINQMDSVNSANEQAGITEFSALLNLEKVKTENKVLELKAKEAQLKHNRSFILLLAITLLVVVILFYREFYLNKRLKISKELLLQKNHELTESEDNLRKARDKAEKASNMKTSFIRNMTHEIRTPLNSIVGFSQIISNQLDENEDTHEFANLIEENSDKLLKLIDDVLNLSDLESSAEINMEETNIHICCEKVLTKIYPHLQKGVNLRFCPENSEFFIRTNEEAVSKILFNLLHNAAKFTEKGEVILAYAISENKDKLFITVTDTGIGIPVDKKDIVFERFTKVSSFSQGCGLGLPLSKLLAQKLGGDLIIDKTNSKGSCFVLTLPI